MRTGLLLLLLSGLAQAEPVIWRCEDLQKFREFSSIQCAPDAQIYVPSRTNAGSIGGGADFDRRYREFLNRHSLQGEREPNANRAPAVPAPTPPATNDSREGRSLQQFKTYTVPR